MVGHSIQLHREDNGVEILAQFAIERGRKSEKKHKENQVARILRAFRISRIKDTCAFQLRQRVPPRCPSNFRLPLSPGGSAAPKSRPLTKTIDLKGS